jgi:hypothetical protein
MKNQLSLISFAKASHKGFTIRNMEAVLSKVNTKWLQCCKNRLKNYNFCFQIFQGPYIVRFHKLCMQYFTIQIHIY